MPPNINKRIMVGLKSNFSMDFWDKLTIIIDSKANTIPTTCMEVGNSLHTMMEKIIGISIPSFAKVPDIPTPFSFTLF